MTTTTTTAGGAVIALPDPASGFDADGLVVVATQSGTGPADVHLTGAISPVRRVVVRWACVDGPDLTVQFSAAHTATGQCGGPDIYGADIDFDDPPTATLHIITSASTRWRVTVYVPVYE